VAAARCDAARVCALLALGEAPEARDSNHATPLLAAMRALRDGLVRPAAALDTLAALLAGGADGGAVFERGFNKGQCALHTALACGEGGAEALALLLARGGARGVRAADAARGETALHAACRGGPRGADVSPPAAAATGAAVGALLAAGADPNAATVEPVGTGGRTVARAALDVLVDRLLSAPVAVAGWPYTGAREWVAVARAIAGAGGGGLLEETRVWCRKAGV
jgi:ankyrin repeat protein